MTSIVLDTELVTFLLLWQIPERNDLKGGRIYSDSQFPRFHSTVTKLHVSGTVLRQKIMVERVSRAEFSALGSRERQEGTRDKIPSKGAPPPIYFLQPGPTSQ
jgi:hypothetical protein